MFQYRMLPDHSPSRDGLVSLNHLFEDTNKFRTISRHADLFLLTGCHQAPSPLHSLDYGINPYPETPSGYWNYIMPELEHLERKWIEVRDKAADAELAPAGSPKTKETR